MANKLETFISHRIAEDEATHHATLAAGAVGFERLMAERWLDECAMKRWTLTFYNRVGRSGEDGASTAWATLTPLLLKMAGVWRTHPDYLQQWAMRDEPETFAERRSRQSVEYARARFSA